MSNKLGRAIWEVPNIQGSHEGFSLLSEKDPYELNYFWVDDHPSDENKRKVHVLTPEELREALRETFFRARAGTFDDGKEEKKDHLVDGLKFVYDTFDSYAKEMGL